jgi:hypothetical protein
MKTMRAEPIANVHEPMTSANCGYLLTCHLFQVATYYMSTSLNITLLGCHS